jgi:hypothetical protein
MEKSDFASRRCTAVTDLRQTRLDVQAELVATPKGQRHELLARARDVQTCLDLWLGVPEPETEQMWSECATPLAWHVWSSNVLEALIGFGPCPAYPGQRALHRRVMAIFEALAARTGSTDTPRPKQPRRDPRTKAQLLETIDRLQAQINNQSPS